MAFEKIKVTNFRNLIDQEINLDFKNIVCIGENGQGKTNFLESIYLSSMGSSFRTRNDKELICEKHDFCVINSKYKNLIHNNIRVTIHNTKSIVIDENKLNDRKELLNISPSIIFSHDDFKFVSGTQELKRWFFDQSISLINICYIDLFRKYKKILKSRNILLKSNDIQTLKSFDIQLVTIGLEIMKYRKSIIKTFSKIMQNLFFAISGIDNVNIRYKPSWDFWDVEKVLELLDRERNNDFRYGITRYGPHRDRYDFYKDGKLFSEKASTGQKRLLSLILRVSQAICFKSSSGTSPILLLDDVLLEMDQEKRTIFLTMLPEYSQAYFAFLNGSSIPLQNNCCIYSVKNGTVLYEENF